MHLYDMMVAARKEQGWPDLDIDWATLVKMYHVIESEHGFIVGLVTDQFILMHNVPIALEIAWYVDPDHRGSGEGMKLYNEFENWAKEQGAKYALVGRYVRESEPAGKYFLKELV